MSQSQEMIATDWTTMLSNQSDRAAPLDARTHLQARCADLGAVVEEEAGP